MSLRSADEVIKYKVHRSKTLPYWRYHVTTTGKSSRLTADGCYFGGPDPPANSPPGLLGSSVADALFEQRRSRKKISVRDTKFAVIGTIEKEGSSMVDNSNDNNVIIPVNYAQHQPAIRPNRSIRSS